MKTKIKHKFLCERSIFRVNYTALIIVSFVFFLYQLVCVLQVEKLQILILFIICLRFQNFTLRFFGRLFWRCAALFFPLSLFVSMHSFFSRRKIKHLECKKNRERLAINFSFFFSNYTNSTTTKSQSNIFSTIFKRAKEKKRTEKNVF